MLEAFAIVFACIVGGGVWYGVFRNLFRRAEDHNSLRNRYENVLDQNYDLRQQLKGKPPLGWADEVSNQVEKPKPGDYKVCRACGEWVHVEDARFLVSNQPIEGTSFYHPDCYEKKIGKAIQEHERKSVKRAERIDVTSLEADIVIAKHIDATSVDARVIYVNSIDATTVECNERRSQHDNPDRPSLQECRYLWRNFPERP